MFSNRRVNNRHNKTTIVLEICQGGILFTLQIDNTIPVGKNPVIADEHGVIDPKTGVIDPKTSLSAFPDLKKS